MAKRYESKHGRTDRDHYGAQSYDASIEQSLS